MQQVAVLDMSRNEARDAIHVTDQPIEEGQAVIAAVDWDRRFDHMQQHTGPWTPMLCFLLLSLSQCYSTTAQALFGFCCHQLGLPKSFAHPRFYCQQDFASLPGIRNCWSCMCIIQDASASS